MTAPMDAPPTDAYRRTLRWVWLIAGVLLLLTWAYVLNQVHSNRQRELSAARTELGNLTRVSQEHAIRTLRSADQVIRFIEARYLEVGSKLDLAALVAKGVIDAEIFPQVGIIDAEGIYALANIPIKGKLDLSDREHFKVHVANDKVGLFVSKPVIGRASGKWSVQLTRRINKPNGEFGGVVVVSIDPGYFTRFYGELQMGADGMAALYGIDGIARARLVGAKEEFGTNAVNSPVFSKIAQGELVGSYSNVSVVDATDRLYYFRKIPQYPLVVFMGKDISHLLANHYAARNALVLQALAMSALLLSLAAVLMHHTRQTRRALEVEQQAQAKLADHAGQMDEIFELSPDGLVSFDTAHRVKYVNPAFTRMTDGGSTTLKGMDEKEFSLWINSLCDAGSRFDGLAALRSPPGNNVEANDSQRSETCTITVKGNKVLQLALRSSESHSVSQVLHMRDVTHEFEVDQIKSEFLSTAAHELRTPLASILGFSELLLTQDFADEEKREFIDIIYKQSTNVSAILNELLDLARIEARRGKDFHLTRLDLNELIQLTTHSFKLPQGRDAPELVLVTSPLWMLGDAGKLRQVLLNVLSNAYKYSPGGGVVRIEVDVMKGRSELPQARIRVTDHGIGMTAEQVKKVWTRFYRADTSGKVPGTGLGMSIVKEIVELHRGEVSITSASGQGTCVTLRLPIDPSQT